MSLFRFSNPHKSTLPKESEALAGRQTPLALDPIHHVLGNAMVAPFPEGAVVVYFGMGCFWGAEKLFWVLPGVHTTAVGYGAGYTPNPTYEEVCSGCTGHNELVQVVYLPDEITFEALLAVFWQNHNPCQGMRQGNDIGTQYRSGIYTTNQQQLDQAMASQRIYNQKLAESGFTPSTTEVRKASPFYYAETYHQQYLAKNPAGYCPNHSCEYTGLPRFEN